MKLSPNFTMEEFIASETAMRRRIDNSLPPELLRTAANTADMMERIRAVLGDKPIQFTSAYRCQELNRAIGSSDTSDHPKAMAVDFKCPDFGTPFAVATFLASQVDQLGIGQLIAEFGSWVHVSTRKPALAANRVITIDSSGTRIGVVR